MARTLGTYILSSNIEIEAGAPLDARTIVPLKADLTRAGSFPYPYVGMEVFVTEELQKYRLIGTNPELTDNWTKTDKGVVDGYYDAEHGGFYKDQGFTKPITGTSEVLYIDKSTDNVYRWNGSSFAQINPIDYQVPTIDMADERENIAQNDDVATIMGKIAKYFDDLGEVAFSDDYDDLDNTPTKLSEFENDPGYITDEGIVTSVKVGNTAYNPTDGVVSLPQYPDISGKADKATTLAGYGITDAKIANGTITLGANTITPLTQHQDISGKADKATTLAGYGITDAKIANGTITLGSNTITPLTQHQDISGKADKSATVSTVTWSSNKLTKTINGTTTDVVTAATILGNLTNAQVVSALGYTPYDSSNPSGYTSNIGTVTGVKMNGTTKSPTSGIVDLGTVITSHQDISGKADKATTLAGYGITDAKIANGVITLGANTITPLTSHQSVTDNNPTLSWGTKSKVATIGSTAINVTMPSNPNTDTKVTSVGNHYAPAEDSTAQLDADASSSTAATWNSTSLVTGVTVKRDAKGHVTGLAVDSIKMPANPNTNTTYTIATGDSNGQIKVTPSSGSAYNVGVKGLGSSAYTTEDSISPYEANLRWGGKNFTSSYGPIDAALMDELGANRLQFTKASAITVEYSRDAGSTWTDYGASDAQKMQIFAQGGGLVIGKADSTNKATANPGKYLLRITIDTGTANIYTVLNKVVVYCSTNGSANCYCKIQKALQSTPTTFVDHTGNISISGWSGYNVINISGLTTYGNTASSQYGRVRFIFGDGTGGNTSYNGLNIIQIKAFGGVGWSTPSTMAKTRHLYSYDENQNATFPANLYMSAGTIITPKDDSKGIRPNTNNYGEVGDASYYFYKSYCTNYYGTTSYVTNWSRNNNIGSPSTSSSASGTGLVNFYNTCAAGGTQTKTTLSVDTSVNSNITVYLPKASGNLALAATTLAGYGITDAKIANGVITLGSNTITPLTSITSSQVTTALGYTPYNSTNPNGYITSSGSCASATKATQDGNGNTISTTYMKKGVDYVTAGLQSGVTIGHEATAEGTHTSPTGDWGHAEGVYTVASGYASHAEGGYSNTEDVGTTASGNNSHAEGWGTIAASANQHVEGKFNVADSDNVYAHIIGGGSSSSARKNIFAVDWSGNATIGGTIITPADDDCGIRPLANNWGQVGKSDRWYYRSFINMQYCNEIRFYGTASISGNMAKLVPGSMSADRILTTPDETGTLATREYLNTNYKKIKRTLISVTYSNYYLDVNINTTASESTVTGVVAVGAWGTRGNASYGVVSANTSSFTISITIYGGSGGGGALKTVSNVNVQIWYTVN